MTLLLAGDEALVRGASTLALRVGISPLVIGLMAVSAATSAPEHATSIIALRRGERDLAVTLIVVTAYEIGILRGRDRSGRE